MIDTSARARNDDLIRSGYETFASGDLAAVELRFRPDAVWHAQRLGQLGGDHVGWPAIAGFFAQTMQLTRGSFRLALEDVLTSETRVAAVVRSRAEREGRVLDDRQVHLFRVDGGRVAEVWQFAGAAADAFWAQPRARLSARDRATRSAEDPIPRKESAMRRSLLALAAAVALALAVTAPAPAGSANGSAGQMPALYDGHRFTINFKEQPSSSEPVLLAHNGSLNTIYMCDSCAGAIAGGDFTSVLDAIPGDGFNPLWQEVQVAFAAGRTPVQLTSDTAILAAAAAGVVTLSPTAEVYRCAVVGAKR